MPIDRFVLENWVPVKLNAEINVQEETDFSSLFYREDPSEFLLDD